MTRIMQLPGNGTFRNTPKLGSRAAQPTQWYVFVTRFRMNHAIYDLKGDLAGDDASTPL